MYKQIVNPKDENEFTRCQKCKAVVVGAPVNRSDRPYYGDFTHYSDMIGLMLDPDFPEIITHWQCPRCKETFPRFS